MAFYQKRKNYTKYFIPSDSYPLGCSPPKIGASTLMNTRLFGIRKANIHHNYRRFISQYDTPYRFNKLDLMAIPSASLCITLITKYSVFVGSETHFKVVVISDTFEGMPLIKVRNILL